MEKLSIFKQGTIKILKQLEYCCESFEMYNPEGKLEENFLWISFGDIDLTVLEKGEHIHNIEKYLQENGVDFHITFDLENEFPDMYIDREHPNDDFIKFGQINGENVKDIKMVIEKLILELNPEEKKDNNVFTKNKDKKIVTIDLPKNATWDNLLLKLKDGLEDIEIFYEDKYIEKANYVELGFSANKKNHKPNRSWELLKILSVLQNEDIKTATVDNLRPMFESSTGHSVKVDNVYKIKKLLSDALKNLFKIEADPFVDKKEYYEPVFKILPETVLRTKEIWSTRLLTGKSEEPDFFKEDNDEHPYNNETTFDN